jgi:hypothetical protein
MTAIDSVQVSLDRLLRARASRTVRCYAPPTVVDVLGAVSSAAHLVLALDVDALERSALARVDRVMLLALEALADTGVHIALVAHHERTRASTIARQLRGAQSVTRDALQHAFPRTPILAISDAPELFAMLGPRDRGLALGRPELASAHLCSIADVAVRATLWWLAEDRRRIATT